MSDRDRATQRLGAHAHATVGTELKCLAKSVTPMTEDPPARTLEKVIAAVLVATWTVGTMLMTIDAVATTVPPYWMPFTALVFLLIGRLWDLEVQKVLPTSGKR
jgi:hypothetical protein